MSKGYTQVHALLGGWAAWVNDGGAVEPVNAAETVMPAPTPTPTPTAPEASKPAPAATTTNKTTTKRRRRTTHHTTRPAATA